MTILRHGGADAIKPIDKPALGFGEAGQVLEQYPMGTRQVGGAKRSPFIVIEDNVPLGKNC